MIIRKNFVPKTLVDIICSSLLLFVFIPYVYWFELYVVLPYFHDWSVWMIFMWTFGTFVAYNIIANLLALILCETSVKGKVLPVEMQPDFKFCSSCECIVPPRSWHCDICNTCILKRDHHCLFSGCCVGLYNYRYFFMFILYLFIALTISTAYNFLYVYNTIDFKDISWINLIFPLAMLAFEYTPQQSVLLIFLLLFVATFFVAILLYLHFCLIRDGQVTHERSTNVCIYNLGPLENIKGCLGVKWYKIWISPFIISELTQDGIYWKTIETNKSK